MAVNWFEGGRRITTLFQWLVGLGFVGYVLSASASDTILFETNHPSGAFSYTDELCEFPSIKRSQPPAIFPDGKKRKVALCFRPESGMKQPYDAFVYLETIAEKNDLEARFKKGDPLIHFGDRNNPDVRSYIVERSLNPSLTQSSLTDAEDNLWKRKPRSIWVRFKETFPFAAGAMGFLWLFSSVIGWIIRGFSGIPKSLIQKFMKDSNILRDGG